MTDRNREVRTPEALESAVMAIVSEALAVPMDRVKLRSSLIDDLGAESIDFLDILYRVETAFSIKIPENELWRGSIDASNPDNLAQGLARLKAEWPDFRWDRVPAAPTREDLPQLITVQTIVDYLCRRFAADADTPARRGQDA